MKRTFLFLIVVAGFAVPVLHSQAPAPAPAPAVAAANLANARQLLESVRESNAKLLEQQTKTLQVLDEMAKTAQQIKTFGQRS